jgi:2-keto-4-pentenoate hydratase/2-oxohepta-3-ene-1,7-dioic acid hydratase in catechol pathway
MRVASIVEGGRPSLVLVRKDTVLPVAGRVPGIDSIRDLAAAGPDAIGRVRDWAKLQPAGSYRPLGGVVLGPAVPEPGAIFTIGHNYRPSSGSDEPRPDRPLVYGKLPSSVSGHGAVVTWDRTVTANVDPEVELGVVIGARAVDVSPEEAMEHVFGYTCVNDVSSRDRWLDGDQWLLGKSMAGFCPVGPWIVTADALAPDDLQLRCTVNGDPIQDGRTSRMRFSIAELVSYLSRHVALEPGDLIVTGTPERLATPPGPERHLLPGDVATVSIEGIGELTTTIG